MSTVKVINREKMAEIAALSANGDRDQFIAAKQAERDINSLKLSSLSQPQTPEGRPAEQILHGRPETK